jgi:hypothetical protein
MMHQVDSNISCGVRGSYSAKESDSVFLPGNVMHCGPVPVVSGYHLPRGYEFIEGLLLLGCTNAHEQKYAKL